MQQTFTGLSTIAKNRKTRFFPLRKRGRTYILTIFFGIFISLLIQNLYTLNIISILICLTITGITILNYNVCISNNIFGYLAQNNYNHLFIKLIWFDFWCLTPISAIFQLHVDHGDQFFSGWRSRSTRREPPTMGKQLVNFTTCGCESSAPFFIIYKARREHTPYWR